MAANRVLSVEEIQKLMRQRAGIEEPPVVEKAHVVRIESPPVSTEPTDQTPKNETLTTQVGKSLSVTQILRDHGIDPIEELLAMYNERNEDPDSPDYGRFVMSRGERVSLMKEIMKYQHPTLKAIEHKGERGDNKITVILMMPDGTQHAKEVEQRGKVINVD